jgi:hypothetical protein
MNKTITKFLIITLLICRALILSAQSTVLGSGGDGTGIGGTFSYSFGQLADQTFFTNYSAIEQGVQHSFETSLVPTNYFLSNTVVISHTTDCFDALQNIQVAGDGNQVIIQRDAVVDFIAGVSIHFLPGFNAVEGSTVHGYITLTNDFCDASELSKIVQINIEKKSENYLSQSNQSKPSLTEDEDQVNLLLYPNPNNGHFMIKLSKMEGKPTIQVYNLTGAIFYKSYLDSDGNLNEITIPTLRKGIYFVRVNNKEKSFIKKMIVE